jgi:hypothetical protein
MMIALLCAGLALYACFRTHGSACTRMDRKDLRRLNRRSEDEYREQIHPFL